LIEVWDAKTGQTALIQQLTGMEAMALSPDGTRLAYVGGQDHNLYVVGSNTGHALMTYPGGMEVLDLAWSPDNTLLAVCFSFPNPTVTILDAHSGQTQASYYSPPGEGADSSFLSVAWSPDGKRAVPAAGVEAGAQVWEPPRNSCCSRITNLQNAIKALQWTSDSTHILSTDAGGSAHLWDACTGQTWLTDQGPESLLASARG
jgi:WD40 repeat protein